jgi:hypothetical protein
MLKYKLNFMEGIIMDKTFFYKGTIPLKSYCKDNNINYNYVVNRKFILIKRDGLSEQQAIDFIIDNYKKHLIFYDGLPLKEYCDLNEINYTTLNTHIYNIMKEKNLSRDDAVNFLIERYHSDRVLIYGIPLPEYCKVNKININSIYAYSSGARKKLGIGKEESYILAIEQYNTKFVLFEGMSLLQYCTSNRYNYNTIMSLRYKNMFHKKMNKDEATTKAVEKYKKFIFLRKRINDRTFLIENKNSINILENYCVENNYDIKIIHSLIETGYDYLQSIFIYQYWLDKKIQITIKNSATLVIDLKQKIEDLQDNEDADITEVIALYYAGFKNFELKVFQIVLPIINKAVYQNPFYDKQEMKQHIILLVIEKLKANFFVSAQNLRSYMKRFVRGELIKYYYCNKNDLSYNADRYENKEYMDYLTDGKTTEDKVINLMESKAIYEVLMNALTPIQIKYVLYRFGFIGYPRNPEEIKKMLNMDTLNINDFETEIIRRVKEVPDVMIKLLK